MPELASPNDISDVMIAVSKLVVFLVDKMLTRVVPRDLVSLIRSASAPVRLSLEPFKATSPHYALLKL
jgi:hypothetical protein